MTEIAVPLPYQKFSSDVANSSGEVANDLENVTRNVHIDVRMSIAFDNVVSCLCTTEESFGVVSRVFRLCIYNYVVARKHVFSYLSSFHVASAHGHTRATSNPVNLFREYKAQGIVFFASAIYNIACSHETRDKLTATPPSFPSCFILSSLTYRKLVFYARSKTAAIRWIRIYFMRFRYNLP